MMDRERRQEAEGEQTDGGTKGDFLLRYKAAPPAVG